jgi:hypothetical protein
MQFWNHIIQTAMLGTDKKQLAIGELPIAIADASNVITTNTNIDREEQFLQLASLAVSYRQSGAQPLRQEGISLPLAPKEERPYCNNKATAVLKDILDEESTPLLTIWLQHCTQKEQLAPPVLLPALLDKANKHKNLRMAVESCMGKRGEWLSAFNPDWQFAAGETDEERWQTGKPDQRRQVLERVRATNSALGRQWLQETWAQENANSKAELLKALAVNLSDKDLEWLESLINEKSQRVKEETLNLLQQIPESSVVQLYWEVVQETVKLKKEFFKTYLSIHLPVDVNETIYKAGITKSNKDQEVIEQLISNIPPSFWESYFKETPEHIYKLFNKDKKSEEFIPAIGQAAGKFKDTNWTKLFIKEEKRIYYDLLPLLSESERDEYLLKRFDNMAEAAVNFLTKDNTNEWKLPVALAVFKHTTANPYQYNYAFYNRNIHLVPVQLLEHLDAFMPGEEYQRNMWRSTSDHIRKLLQLKLRTIQSFS